MLMYSLFPLEVCYPKCSAIGVAGQLVRIYYTHLTPTRRSRVHRDSDVQLATGVCACLFCVAMRDEIMMIKYVAHEPNLVRRCPGISSKPYRSPRVSSLRAALRARWLSHTRAMLPEESAFGCGAHSSEA